MEKNNSTVDRNKLGIFRHGSLVTKSAGLSLELPLTNCNRGLKENFDARMQYYKNSENFFEQQKREIERLRDRLKTLHPVKERVQYKDLEGEIKDREAELEEAKRRLNESRDEYIFAIADTVRKDNDKTTQIATLVGQKRKLEKVTKTISIFSPVQKKPKKRRMGINQEESTFELAVEYSGADKTGNYI